MLSRLHIRNYVLIDTLDVEFPRGLVIITGQTGAGKSILLGALSLLGGCKADAASISQGQDSCVVEAEFDTDGLTPEIDAILAGNDIEKDGNHIIIRRTVNISGRSRCFVNDSPVSVQVLGELSSRLIDIHSQHQSLLLTDHRFQLGILDNFCGNAGLLEQCRSSWQSLGGLCRERETLSSRLKSISEQSEYNLAVLSTLKAANLRPGELEELEEEQKQLANAELIKESLAAAGELFSPVDGQGICESLRESVKYLRKVTGFVPGAEELCDRMESSRIELEDISQTIADLDSGVNLSQNRLEAVEDRMSEIYSLLRRHNCSDVGELIALRDSLSSEAGGTADMQERLEELDSLIGAARKEYSGFCAALHDSRLKAAPAFASEIVKSLKYLELERGDFRVDITQAPEGPSGEDGVLFRFSSNGTVPVDVAKCASGGEISRIMLCLKEMMARFQGMPTLVFDEIDTGVSGSVADKMGSMICSMGSNMQVFSITHLPQVAAKGKAHYLVSKEFDGERSVSGIRLLDRQGRVQEIARLLSGSTITAAAVANAESLLDA